MYRWRHCIPEADRKLSALYNHTPVKWLLHAFHLVGDESLHVKRCSDYAKMWNSVFSCHQNQTYALQSLWLTWQKPFLTQKKNHTYSKTVFFCKTLQYYQQVCEPSHKMYGQPNIYRVFAKPVPQNSESVNDNLWSSLKKWLNTHDCK
jgi:hypothetical protein